MSDRASDSPRYIIVFALPLLALVSAFALGADPAADYPRLDGGFFLAVINQIISQRFALPQTIAFNGLQVPFAYSPLAFYAVASIAKVTALSVPRGMNLWVILWDAAIAPAAYYAARQFLRSRAEALVACAVLIVAIPLDSVFLGTGGGITRAPGFVFFLVACGAMRKALATSDRGAIVLAGASAALVTLTHMEYALLLAISFAVLFAFAPQHLRTAVAVVIISMALAGPWFTFVCTRHSAAIISAMHVAGISSPLAVAMGYLSMVSTSWITALECIALLIALLSRRYLWPAWILALTIFDPHNPVAIHLPLALAVGWLWGGLWNLPELSQARPTVAVLAILGFELGTVHARDAVNQYLRLKDADVQNIMLIGARVEPNALVAQLYPGVLERSAWTDTPNEWIPALINRRSPIARAGLEWIDYRAFSRSLDDWYRLETCVPMGSTCVVNALRYLSEGGRPIYLFVPAHGGAYSLVFSELRTNRSLQMIFQRPSGSVFRLISPDIRS